MLAGLPLAVGDDEAARLLTELGATVLPAEPWPRDDWASSGAMALTGRADGPPLRAPGRPAAVMRGALLATELLARAGGWDGPSLPGPELLGERAALAGLARRAPFSAGGALRVLRCADGPLGLSLPRPSDWESLPALLGRPVSGWADIEAVAAARSAVELVELGRLLGLGLGRPGEAAGPAIRFAGSGPRRPWRWEPPVVVDLSSLWAGPLCAHLLGLLGARVIKVESSTRPDGARLGSRAFYDLLHAGHESVALDLGSPDGRRLLGDLLEVADVVVEASRPRALEQLGIDADALSRSRCWLSITGHGLTDGHAVGFGDDAAIAGGLLAVDPHSGTFAPCGDAIADPLAGAHAALAAVACRLGGSTGRVDIALSGVAASCLGGDEWRIPHYRSEECAIHGQPQPPRARRATGRAADLGEHTDAVCKELLC